MVDMGASAEKVVRQKWCLLRRLWTSARVDCGPARRRARSAGEAWPQWRAQPAWRSARCARGETPEALVHLDQLARTPSADLRDRHQPHWQHDQPRWSRRARPTRSSALSHRQEDLKEGTARTEGRARRVSRRLELRHQIAHGTALTGRLRRSRSPSAHPGRHASGVALRAASEAEG